MKTALERAGRVLGWSTEPMGEGEGKLFHFLLATPRFHHDPYPIHPLRCSVNPVNLSIAASFIVNTVFFRAMI